MRTKVFFIAILLVTFIGYAQSAEGSWEGVLKAGGNELRVVFSIEKGESGYSATLDSPDQNAYDIPFTSVEISEEQGVVMTIEKMGISYEGKLNQADTLEGTFTQAGMGFPLHLTRQVKKAEESVVAKEYLGTWKGILEANEHKIKVVFKVYENSGGLAATLDSPDQGAFDIPFTKSALEDGILKLEMEKPPIMFKGQLNGESTLEGTFNQAGFEVPLLMQKEN